MSTRPLLVGVVLVLAITAAVILAGLALGAPSVDIQKLALVLAGSGVGSLLLGVGLVRLAGGRVGTLQLRITLANGVGLLMALINVLVASSLMFLDSRDLALYGLLLTFAAVISLAFGYSLATALMRELGALMRTAAQLAAGDLAARVGPVGSGEVASLAATFDSMADRLQAAFTRQQELETARRELLVALSHDLRTPLATTQAMVEAIADGVLSDPSEVRHYLQVIRGEVQHLTRLIDELDGLSQAESGAIELQRVPTSLMELVTETVAAYEARARERHVALDYQVEPDLPAVAADPEQLQRILRYLVENALRSTPSGGSVRVDARSDGADARVSVSDSGPAPSQEAMERAFDPFYRAEPARSRTAGLSTSSVGGGFGLALARALVEAHGGRIWVEPSAAGGAVFHLTVPFEAS